GARQPPPLVTRRSVLRCSTSRSAVLPLGRTCLSSLQNHSPTTGRLTRLCHYHRETAMPIRHCIVHLIEKKPDGTPAVLHARDSELGESQAMENLLADLNESYNAKQGKAWGYFHEESGAYPFSGWLSQYMEGKQDFTAFSR